MDEMTNWLVVANSARARVLADSGIAGSYETVADLVHPQSRQKGVELGSDAPGRVEGAGHGTGSSQFLPRSDPHEHEQERFAQQLAAMLNAGVADGRCAGLVLVASNPFLGHLKAHLGEQASKHVLRTVPSDYTTLSEADLSERLGSI
jgi:protein required for attachment to host cells